jgi:hypothetical protein
MTEARQAKLVRAVMKWSLLYRAANKARARRGGYVCEGENEGEPPCWKTWSDESPTDGGPELLPRDEWCQPCLRRQKFHEAYRRLARRRGAAQRGVLYHAKQADVPLGVGVKRTKSP